MNSYKLTCIWMLFTVAFASRYSLANDFCRDNVRDKTLHSDSERSALIVELQTVLRNEEHWQSVLRDKGSIQGILQHAELRQEMLKYPCFIRQMMQINDLRQELLKNNEMMYEMLCNRDIHREINRNFKMVEEMEKNEGYRKVNQEQQSEVLEELLLETNPPVVPSHSP